MLNIPHIVNGDDSSEDYQANAEQQLKFPEKYYFKCYEKQQVFLSFKKSYNCPQISNEFFQNSLRHAIVTSLKQFGIQAM